MVESRMGGRCAPARGVRPVHATTATAIMNANRRMNTSILNVPRSGREGARGLQVRSAHVEFRRARQCVPLAVSEHRVGGPTPSEAAALVRCYVTSAY